MAKSTDNHRARKKRRRDLERWRTDREARNRLTMEDALDDGGWLCQCGNFEDSALHCFLCGNEPPWGCPCALHDEDSQDDFEEELFEEMEEAALP